jgi:TnpA family transposase
VFALFDLLGYRFSPRLKDLPDQTLCRIDRETKYRTIDSLLSRPINTKLILDHYDDLLRLAGSLKLGWVTASLIISKLQAHPRQNSLTKALAEYGCLIKTRFIMQYLMDEGIRKNVHRQLNKGEALHAVRRFLLFANEGKIRRSQDDAQTNQAGCLNVATNAIVAWNTVYMQAVIDQLKAEGYDVQDDDLKHISPARHEHINPYGKYEFNVETVLAMKGLRPLRK